jgi:hypothetical protein
VLAAGRASRAATAHGSSATDHHHRRVFALFQQHLVSCRNARSQLFECLSQAAFGQVWLERDSHLDKVPGFVEFHLERAATLFGCSLVGSIADSMIYGLGGGGSLDASCCFQRGSFGEIVIFSSSLT